MLACFRFGRRRFVLHVIGQLAAHTAIGANGIHGAVSGGGVSAALGINQGGGHQGPGRASLHTFAAGNAGAVAHGVIKIKHHFGRSTTVRQAYDVVALHFAAGTLAQAAGDAGVQIDVHGRMSGVMAPGVGQRLQSRRHMVNRGLVAL